MGKPALSQQEKKKSQDQELVVKAIEALHKVDGVPSTGPAPQFEKVPAEDKKPIKVGPAPKPTDKTFTAIISDPAQITGAMDTLNKKVEAWNEAKTKRESSCATVAAITKQIDDIKRANEQEAREALNDAREKDLKMKELANNAAELKKA